MVDWKKPPTEALHDVQVDAALADQHAEEGRVAAAHSATGVAYEKLDVDPPSIIRLGIVLVAVTIVVAGAMFGLFRLLRTREARSDPARGPLAVREVGRVPPEPRLQTTPLSDLETMKAEQRGLVDTYGWVDAAAGKVRIPVEEAVRLYVQRRTTTTEAETAMGRGTGVVATEVAAPNDSSAPYPPGSGAAWPGAPSPGAPPSAPSYPPGMTPLSSPAPAPVPEEHR